MSRETADTTHFSSMFDRGMPLVFFDRVCEQIKTHQVVVDDFSGAMEATEHLITQGCQRIAHLAGPTHLNIGKKRIEGYKAALTKHGLPVHPEYIIDCSQGTVDEGLATTQKLLALPNPPDAIFANNDIAGLGAMKGIKANGLKIPEDIAVVGFSDWQFSSMTEPALSSVLQPGFEMGQEAAKLLIEMIEMDDNEPLVPEIKMLKTKLIQRASSMKAIEVR